jgi:hypothetical protein
MHALSHGRLKIWRNEDDIPGQSDVTTVRFSRENGTKFEEVTARHLEEELKCDGSQGDAKAGRVLMLGIWIGIG